MNWDRPVSPRSIPSMADLIRMGDDGTLQVPDEPIIPFIEGDGTGVDIWPAAKLVLDAAAAKHGHKVAWKEVLAGTYALEGSLPVNTDGGLKSFGHPVGASGLRMHYECWLQLRGEAPENRSIQNDRKLAVVHNLGGYPGEMVSFVSVVGSELG